MSLRNLKHRLDKIEQKECPVKGFAELVREATELKNRRERPALKTLSELESIIATSKDEMTVRLAQAFTRIGLYINGQFIE